MGYTLQGIITSAPNSDLLKMYDLHSVELGESGLSLIPIPYDFDEEERFPFLPLLESHSGLGSEILDLCLKLSADTKLAYVEAMYHGGQGTQANQLFMNGQEVTESKTGDSAINEALSWIGVLRAGDQDEFDVVGLGMHRDTNDWHS
mgnify:CR=1 FL=1